VSFGLSGASTGTNPRPATFVLNGAGCSVA
jgi:hypothetical protein